MLPAALDRVSRRTISLCAEPSGLLGTPPAGEGRGGGVAAYCSAPTDDDASRRRPPAHGTRRWTRDEMRRIDSEICSARDSILKRRKLVMRPHCSSDKCGFNGCLMLVKGVEEMSTSGRGGGGANAEAAELSESVSNGFVLHVFAFELDLCCNFAG